MLLQNDLDSWRRGSINISVRSCRLADVQKIEVNGDRGGGSVEGIDGKAEVLGSMRGLWLQGMIPAAESVIRGLILPRVLFRRPWGSCSHPQGLPVTTHGNRRPRIVSAVHHTRFGDQIQHPDHITSRGGPRGLVELVQVGACEFVRCCWAIRVSN